MCAEDVSVSKAFGGKGRSGCIERGCWVGKGVVILFMINLASFIVLLCMLKLIE